MPEYFENLDTASIKDSLIFLDVDGTLVADNQASPSEEVLKKVKSLSLRNIVWLCSNSFNGNRNEIIHNLTKLPIIKGHRKPSKKILSQVSKEDRVLSDGSARKIIVIGDKILTDGFFARRIGAEFIKVKRKIGKDRLCVKIYNLLDNIAYTFLKKIF